MLVQPGQGGAAQIFSAGCRHHTVIRLKERFNDDAELRQALVEEMVNLTLIEICFETH